jgi:hypothetical protein
MKNLLIVISVLAVLGCLILLKLYLTSNGYLQKNKKQVEKIADIQKLQSDIRSDSLYQVKDMQYRDSAILIAVANPDKSGTDIYFNKKYALNNYGNINMVYVFDTAKLLDTVSFDDALMATGKKMGAFQDQWTANFIDSSDKSCKPLKKFLQEKMKFPESFKNEETVYQPASIHKMQVVCKYRYLDSAGKRQLKEVTAQIGADGSIISSQ